MKVRTDFVSNSSSSSFIIATKESQYDMINYIVDNARTIQYDEAGEMDNWHPSFDDKNREYLECRINTYVKLLIGSFSRYPISENSGFHHIDNDVVLMSDVKSIIENGKVKIQFDDVLYGKKWFKNAGYKMYEITQDSIDFTRWVLSNCVDSHTDADILAVHDYFANKLTEAEQRHEVKPSDSKLAEYNSLLMKCNGKVVAHDVSYYENGKELTKPLAQLLDEYEALLKAGNRIYRFCVGSSGEGTDWGSYIWTDRSTFKTDDKYTFVYDPEW